MIDLIEKNKEYILDIISQGYEGEGIAKVNDTFPVFVEGALKGERVNARIVKVKKNFAYGKLVDIIEPSSERCEAKCNIHKRCGGCKLQHSDQRFFELWKNSITSALWRTYDDVCMGRNLLWSYQPGFCRCGCFSICFYDHAASGSAVLQLSQKNI